MKVSSTEMKRCDVVQASGRIDSQTAPKLAEAFDKITEAGRFKIVLDLSEVEFISSAGLRVLINTQKQCKRFNRGHVALAGMSAQVSSALELAGFLPLFEIYDTVVDAVGSF